MSAIDEHQMWCQACSAARGMQSSLVSLSKLDLDATPAFGAIECAVLAFPIGSSTLVLVLRVRHCQHQHLWIPFRVLRPVYPCLWLKLKESLSGGKFR